MFRFGFSGLLLLTILGGLVLPDIGRAQQTPESTLTLEMLQRIERLETEVRQIRGELEIQRHQLELLQQERATAGYSGPPPGAAATTPSTAPPGTEHPPYAPPARSAGGGTEQADFDIALSELREGRYPQAIAGLQRFLSAYPNGGLAGDAQYWLGESYYLSRNYDAAKEAFINMGLRYPQNARLPDVLLKLGYIYGEQGEITRAREVLQKLVQVYPNSQAAGLAERRLQSLR